MTRKYQAVLFDLDGTLIDSAPDLAKTINDLCKSYQRPEIDYQHIRPIVSYGARKLISLAFGDDLHESREAELRQEFLTLYKTQNCVHTDFFPHIPELLQALESAQTPWGIVTNKHTDCTENIVQTLKLSSRTNAIVCGDTLSVSKPNPEPILHACELLAVEPSRCVYVGDCVRDVMAGRAAGMQTIACEFGYTNGEDVRTWGADYIAEQPNDIIKFL